MKGLWMSNIKRAFFSKWYFIAIIGTVIMSYISSQDYMKNDGNPVCVIELMINLGMFKKIVVFFSSIPFITVFCQDYNSGYINSILSRTKKNHYISSNLMICVLSGFTSVFSGLILFYGVISVKIPPQAYETPGVYSNLSLGNPLLYVLVFTSIFSLYATMWTAFGLALSSIIPDKYIALGSPLILGYLLEEITCKFPSCFNLYHLSHPGIKVFGNTAVSNYFYTIIVFIFGIVVSGYIFSYFVKRRIRNEIF